MPRYHVGTSGVSAKNHAICEGPHVVAVVLGAGYPAGKGRHPRTEALTAEIVAKLNAAERDADYADPDRFLNHYHCPCGGEAWSDVSPSVNNDRCPVCDAEIEPCESEDLP